MPFARRKLPRGQHMEIRAVDKMDDHGLLMHLQSSHGHKWNGQPPTREAMLSAHDRSHANNPRAHKHYE